MEGMVFLLKKKTYRDGELFGFGQVVVLVLVLFELLELFGRGDVLDELLQDAVR